MLLLRDTRMAGVAPGVVETWGGTGAVGSDWTDASEAWPTVFAPLTRSGGMVTSDLDDHVQDTFDTGLFQVLHATVYRPMGATTGEVTVMWDASRSDYDRIHQVGPAFAVDVDAADPAQCGITMNGDASVQSIYAQNIPRIAPMSEVFDYTTIYEVFTDTLVNDAFASGIISLGRHWMTLRVTDTHFAAYIDGRRLGVPVAIPAWAAGRDSWGLHMVSISRISTDDPPARVDTWCWRPWTGTL